MPDLTPEEIADGLALWEEHKPQTADDWRAVARRCLADPSTLNPEPVFAALLSAEARVAELERRVSNLKNALFEIAGLRRTSIRWPEIANAAIDRDGMKGKGADA